jgi:putative PIN family toxin of toxin-antitoxin system
MERVVIDTNIFVSAIMNPAGAPRSVLRLALTRQIGAIIGNALFCEYESVLGRDSLWEGGLLDRDERERLFDALMSVSAWVPIYYLWRPNLPDEGDNHLLELAVAGGADAIITANKRDLTRSELRFPSVRIETAGEFLERRSTI